MLNHPSDKTRIMETKIDKPRICLVAHNAYGAVSGAVRAHVGGIERQQALMAHWLARRGYPVSLVTWDEGQPQDEHVHGVRIIKMCSREAGVNYLRFIYPKWTSLYQALRRANAEIYYYNCGDLGLGQLALWCRLHGRRYVYSVASDPDCDPRLPSLRPLRERILYRYGLRRADRVIVQTHRQRALLRTGFGRDAFVLPMPCAGMHNGEQQLAQCANGKDVHVLWVGRFSPEKRLDWLLDLAGRCRRWTFDIVGAPNRGSKYGEALARRAAGLANVKLHGRVPYNRMAEFYLRATALCCTSSYEGFPNTFLEAWSVGLPVVSTFDPDDLIARRGLGALGNTVGDLAEQLKTLVRSPARWQAASGAGRQYYQANHKLEVSMRRFEAVFRELAGQRNHGSSCGSTINRTKSQERSGVGQ